MNDKLYKVGQYSGEYNELLDIELPQYDIYVSEGLKKHIRIRHRECLQYIESIEDIIKSPDYVGKNPREPNSIELVKIYDNNIQIRIKLDISNEYLYVATLFDVKQAKIDRRLYSGRLKKIK